jgi:hypothetical protein
MLAQLKSADTITGQPKTEKATSDAYNYKTDPDFVANIAGINANPTTALQNVKNNSAQLIQDYGWDGYQALLAAAKGGSPSASSNGVTLGQP